MGTAWWRAETWDWHGHWGFVGAMTVKYKVEKKRDMFPRIYFCQVSSDRWQAKKVFRSRDKRHICVQKYQRVMHVWRSASRSLFWELKSKSGVPWGTYLSKHAELYLKTVHFAICKYQLKNIGCQFWKNVFGELGRGHSRVGFAWHAKEYEFYHM